MKSLLSIFLICAAALPAFCQSTSEWKVGTITEVRIHETGEKAGASDAVSYDVSVSKSATPFIWCSIRLH
jgi:hypothetical protein